MTKEECGYCATEEDCIATEHTMDCIFCECQNKYPTNDTCPRCLHDRSWCECSEQEQQKEINDMIEKMRETSEEFRKEWDALSRSGIK